MPLLKKSPAIRIQNARLIYDKKYLFDQLNCYLPAGKITCLLGQSGVGKSSLLRLIAGLLPDENTSACVTAEDRLPLQGRIATMGQTDLLLPWLTALENVMLGSALRHENKIIARERAHALLIQLNLQDSMCRYPSELSGGMRQRIALARTLFEDRPIVLMDEPFSSVDAITRLALQELTTESLAQRTVLLVTHDPMEAFRMADRIYIMKGSPARCDVMIEPPGRTPRDLGDVASFHFQKLILKELLAHA